MTASARFLEQTLASLTSALPRWSSVQELIENRLQPSHHGDMPRWRKALDALPTPDAARLELEDAFRLEAQLNNPAALRQTLMELHPWRKGPFHIGDVHIDTEWRSDWKWQRLSKHLPELAGKRVLDVGSGNGYYGWRLLGAGAASVIGVDPTLLFVMQHAAISHLAGEELSAHNLVLPLSLEDAPVGDEEFGVVMSMGVLYHRRNQQDHLQSLLQHLQPGGLLVLETLVTPDGVDLIPDGRYARMRNVWCVNGVQGLIRTIGSLGCSDVRCVDTTVTTTDEQRSTDWMHFESFEHCLDASDPSRTIEGHPAPRRAIILARKQARAKDGQLAESPETS
ncbi:MAG: tRNA 5-methoxyuridine(34)/uridine 5-oxyacetic acid(34) synthase CmoB [Pseudomonadaceae bacterium]|nr:tRNA 5-methoxyuridine(34)/uridine 5-oxyacetic acid(34) synthase CmoB [Pseudomonadaceae bacterium]